MVVDDSAGWYFRTRNESRKRGVKMHSICAEENNCMRNGTDDKRPAPHIFLSVTSRSPRRGKELEEVILQPHTLALSCVPSLFHIA